MKVYKFSDFFLDAVQRRIFKGGQIIEPTPRAFDVLLLLVENAGVPISKNDLIREVWRDSFVEEGNIAVHISKLRKLLGATKSEPFIETVSGVGYQFVSLVSVVGDEEWKQFVSQNKNSSKVSEKNPLNLDSILVLPFQNVTRAPELEYLADGLTESLINNLSFIPEIKVIARNTAFRFKDSPAADAREIGAKLNVAAILTGRVKVIDDNVIIGAEMMKVSDGTQLWGKQFNQPFADIFEIQEKIARSISEVLRLKISDLAKKSVHGQPPQNVRAYSLYLKGRHFWAKRNVSDTNRAIKYFQQSIAADPRYTASYVGMADCYISLYQLEQISRNQTLSHVSTIMERVSEFDETAPEALTMLGWTKQILEWDWEKAEFCYQKSLTINPNNNITLLRYGHLLLLKGKFAAAVEQHRRALMSDPLSTILNVSLGRVFYFMEQFDNALTQLQETLELDPENHLALLLLGATLAAKEKYSEALGIFQGIPDARRSIESLSMIGYVQALAGRKEEALEIIQEIEYQSKIQDLDATNLAYIHVALGEIEKAFACLEKAFQQHSVDLLGVKVDPRLKPLRHDPRFQNLVEKIGITSA